MLARLVLVVSMLVTVCAMSGCTSAGGETSRAPSTGVRSAAHPSRSGPGNGGSTTRTSTPARSRSTGVSTDSASLVPARAQLTPQGMWWAVDSTVPLSADSLANVRRYYRGHPTPVAWGRYLTGSFALRRSEITFARRHGIALYLLMPDDNCSGCGGGDTCGNDRTPAQASQDADKAIRAARRLGLPRGVALFKDVEEVTGCHGELTAAYLRAWYRVASRSEYRAGFYGNSTTQSYDFPRAYCQAVRADPAFASVMLAQDEPEPALGAARGTIGPRNAPRFAPNRPSCVPRAAVRIWQYGESVSSANVTDVDEIRPGTPGLLLPDGSASRSTPTT